MTPFEYVTERLAKDFRDRADYITDLLNERMAELTDPRSVVEEETPDDFQKFLSEKLYPFIACIRALRDAGLTPEEADHYARDLWNEMPGKVKREITQIVINS